MGVMWPDEVAATWLEENAGIPALNNENMKLYIMSEESHEDVCCSEISLDNLRLWVCVSEEGCRKFYYFNSTAHYSKSMFCKTTTDAPATPLKKSTSYGQGK